MIGVVSVKRIIEIEFFFFFFFEYDCDICYRMI